MPRLSRALILPSLSQFLDEPLPTVQHWTSQQVGQWLHSLNLEQYAAEFAARQVDGPQLLQLDGSKLKVGQSARIMTQPEPEANFKNEEPLMLTFDPQPCLLNCLSTLSGHCPDL